MYMHARDENVGHSQSNSKYSTRAKGIDIQPRAYWTKVCRLFSSTMYMYDVVSTVAGVLVGSLAPYYYPCPHG